MKKLALTAMLAIALTAGIAESSNGINTSNFCDCQGIGIPNPATKQIVPIGQPTKPKRAEVRPGVISQVEFLIMFWFNIGMF